MTTDTRLGRHTGISTTKDRRGYWHFHRELPPPPDPGPGKRRRLDKSDRIRSEARRKFDEALAGYERTGRVRTSRPPLLRDWLDRWLEEYKCPNAKPRVYETYRSDCRNIAATIGNIRLQDLEPRHVHDMVSCVTGAARPSSTRASACATPSSTWLVRGSSSLTSATGATRPGSVPTLPSSSRPPSQPHLTNPPDAHRGRGRFAFGTGMR